jgi:cell wall-associated NlpC family hydrolase
MSTTIRRTFARALTLVGALIAGLTLFVVPAPKAEAMTNFGYKVSQVAASREGMPYAYGANGPTRFDCSGLTQWTFARLGKSLPRSSSAQYAAVKHIQRDYRRKGDLVFFYNGGGIYHVGIYVANGYIWHSPFSGAKVRLERIWTSQVRYGRVA